MAVSSYPERKFTDVNSAFVTITGFSKEDVIGRTSQELGLFVEPEKLASVSQALRANGNVRDVELKTRKKNGTIADGLFFGEIIDSQGQKSLLSVMIDISYQKRLENQLRQAAQTFKTVADFTWAWEYWIGPDGSLSYISPSCERITGYHPVEFLNNPGLVQEIIHTEDRPSLVVIWTISIKGPLIAKSSGLSPGQGKRIGFCTNVRPYTANTADGWDAEPAIGTSRI